MTEVVLAKGANVVLPDGPTPIVVTAEVVCGDGPGTDAAVVMLGGDGRVRSTDDLVFYNQPNSPDGSVQLLPRGDDVSGTSRDSVQIALRGVPEDVERIVVGVSLDAPDTVLGDADRVAMIVTVASAPIAVFPIEGLTSERAVVFGEVYRRGDGWKLRAVGQGYADGLEALVTDYGVDVDADESGESPAEAESADADPDGPAAAAQPDAGTVRIQKARRPVRLPADWRDRIHPYLRVPTVDPEFHRARVFPTVGAKSSTDQEQRSTSILLSMLEIVPEFGRAVLGAVGAPGGRIETFTEPSFAFDGGTARPDGLIRVVRGGREWVALLEVKTGHRRLDAEQIGMYLAVAKAQGYDSVVSLSTELADTAGGLAVDADPKLLKAVALQHLAWEEVIAIAAIALDHTGVGDRERRRLLHEFLLYAAHPSSGMGTFDDMGRHWVRVRDAVKTRTISSRDSAPADVCRQFDRLIRHTGLQLSAMLGQRVQAIAPGEHRDAVSRARQLADSGKLFGSLRTAGLAGPILVEADLARDRASCSVTVTAPKSGRPSTHVNWLLRQLGTAGPRTRVAAHHAGTRESTAVLLADAQNDPASLVPSDGRGIREFTVTVDQSIATKRAGSAGGFPAAITHLVNEFYADIACSLRPPTG